jgi:hypothetical protein
MVVDEIIDKLAEDMRKEMDYDVMVDMLEWTKVELPGFSSRYHSVDVVEWCHNNCTGKFINFGVRYAFEKTCDAEWFILRWQ